MARLAVYPGESELEGSPLFSWRLARGRTRIGRTDDCDLVLPDDQVSRSHCLVDFDGSGLRVTDRSSNGTFVNGARIDRCQAVVANDVLRVGSFYLRVIEELEEPRETTDVRAEARHEEIFEAGNELAVSQAWLVIVSGPGEGKRLRLRGGRLSVGGAGSKVVLPDPALVRDHLRIRLLQGRTMVEPGTGAAFVGGVRVRDVFPLYPGEDVRLGACAFRVDWDTAVERPTADRFGEMVGTSPAMRQCFGLLRRMAAHHAPVLLLGESGTGKELAARGLHDSSPRSSLPFVALNCGAITATLFESELFGHEKGAFTNADSRRDGAFQRAEGGTLFLDEVGELPEEAQAKLLRALETGEVRRVGGAAPTFPDVRVIAATNRPLHEDTRSGRFRSDLYFRLAVLAVRLPSLRERREDIPTIAKAILARLQPDARLSPSGAEALARYDWPGNARELRNVLTRTLVLAGPVIEARNIVFSALDGEPPAEVLPREAIDEIERDVVIEALRKHGQNRSEAARALGMPRSSLLYKLNRWGIDKE